MRHIFGVIYGRQADSLLFLPFVYYSLAHPEGCWSNDLLQSLVSDFVDAVFDFVYLVEKCLFLQLIGDNPAPELRDLL